MEFELAKWALLALLGVAQYFFNRTLNQMDKDNAANKIKIDALTGDLMNIRKEYLHKDDFKDFKAELWQRFDRLEGNLIRKNNAD